MLSDYSNSVATPNDLTFVRADRFTFLPAMGACCKGISGSLLREGL